MGAVTHQYSQAMPGYEYYEGLNGRERRGNRWYQKKLCGCGSRVSKEIWEAATSKTLVCVEEPENSHDRNAVAVGKDGKVIGHVPQRIVMVVRSFF